MAERLRVTTLEEADLPELERFLLTVFQLAPGHRPFRLDALRWKAFGAHPLAAGSRSYIVRYGGTIIGHGMMIPLRFRGVAESLTAQCIVDWAADPAMGGGGVLVYRHLAKLADVQIGIGGSDEGQKTIQRLGFRMQQRMYSFEWIVRPWAWRTQSGQQDWKTPLRIGRDWWRHRRGLTAAPRGLTARRVERFAEAGPLPVPDAAVVGGLVSERSAGSLNHALLCPIARMEAHLIIRQSETAGYFVLSRVGAECRIADLWIRSEAGEDWAAGAVVAAQTAAQDPVTAAVFTAVSTARVRAAFEQAGFRATGEHPVFLLDPGRRIAEGQEILLSMLDNDAFYL